jgi:uncharacterized protein (TIGR02271 family)
MSMSIDATSIQPGWEVRSSDGEKIGEIEAIGSQEMHVRKGLIFTSDRYIPLQAVSAVEPENQAVYLSVTKDEVETISGDEPGTASMSMSGAYTEQSTYGDDGGAVAQQTADVGTQGYIEQTDVAIDQTVTPVQTTQQATGDTVRVEAYEEQLQAQKMQQQAGEVTISKDIVEEARTIEVPVTREEVRVERRPATGASLEGSADAFTGDTITVPVMEEEVQVQKVARPVEEIEISKEIVTETESVSDTVRRERIEVGGEGDLTEPTGR